MTRLSFAEISTLLLFASSCASSDGTGASGTAATTPTARSNGVGTAATASATTSASSSTSADAPYACEKDADCYVSCKHGAVNRAWYDAAKLPECKDGCQMGTDKVKCEGRVCVAYSGDNRVDGCTKRPIQTKD